MNLRRAPIVTNPASGAAFECVPGSGHIVRFMMSASSSGLW
jgi:hypothetical protein